MVRIKSKVLIERLANVKFVGDFEVVTEKRMNECC